VFPCLNRSGHYSVPCIKKNLRIMGRSPSRQETCFIPWVPAPLTNLFFMSLRGGTLWPRFKKGQNLSYEASLKKRGHHTVLTCWGAPAIRSSTVVTALGTDSTSLCYRYLAFFTSGSKTVSPANSTGNDGLVQKDSRTATSFRGATDDTQLTYALPHGNCTGVPASHTKLSFFIS
jgi:hypothetical protein